MVGCTVKSTAWEFKGVEKWGQNLGVKIKVFKNSVSFFEFLTFTIFSTIIPFPIFTKKNGVGQPDIPEGR